jgi:glycosyltransferase involved in cell wall biosynthesis
LEPIPRHPRPADLVALARYGRWIRGVEPDVVHGHGSKGGALARTSWMAGFAPAAARVYTPHGGSFNYQPGSAAHRFYMTVERLLAPLTDAFLFESAYIASRFDSAVGAETRLCRVVVNGLGAAEFARIDPNPGAADFVYIGELRAAKGVDTLMEALAQLDYRSPLPRLVIVGSGGERERLLERSAQLGVSDRLSFVGPLPFRVAMTLGRILVAPSRAESLPYVLLEAAAARVPIVATDVGGVSEIFGPYRDRLGPCGDPADLARRMADALDREPLQHELEAADLSRFVARNFAIESMADAVLCGYRDALAARRKNLPSRAAARRIGVGS